MTVDSLTITFSPSNMTLRLAPDKAFSSTHPAAITSAEVNLPATT
jgi:hypothetical protein